MGTVCLGWNDSIRQVGNAPVLQWLPQCLRTLSLTHAVFVYQVATVLCTRGAGEGCQSQSRQ